MGEQPRLSLVYLLFLSSLSVVFFGTQAVAATPVPARGIDRKALTADKASERWEKFRDQFRGQLPVTDNLPGFAFKARLEKFPRRGEVITRKGFLYGLWSDQGLLRMDFPSKNGEKSASVVFRNGTSPEAWRLASGDKEAQKMEAVEFFDPLAIGIDYSGFDALMPFIHWDNVSYVGSGRVIGRVSHLFSCLPPKEMLEIKPDIRSVRVAVDDAYNALLRVEIFGRRGVVDRKFSVIGFKKVRDVWIVKTIDLLDTRSREKTRLRIEAAAVDLSLGPEIFRKENLDRLPDVPEKSFVFFD
ncbi:MAG: hypothetical protein CMI31_12235 [Opitutae bacterium]|nr:hypothetical protein [Opitutae bacterium]|tara:strand:+ start:150 stop:1049 length:900 start_codon:yes stop_codon:yes gene_type:complete